MKYLKILGLISIFSLLCFTIAKEKKKDKTKKDKTKKEKKKKEGMADVIPLEDIPPAPILNDRNALNSFKIAGDFKLDLVVSAPKIKDPVAISFDGNGRIWVCEMTTFMPNIEGTGETVPKGNIVVLEDTDHDGKINTRTVFLKNVILPRAIANVKGGIIFSDHKSLYFCEVKRNLKAGDVEKVDPKYAAKGTLEHSANGFIYNLDNWYYNAKSSQRYRILPITDTNIPVGAEVVYTNTKFKWKLIKQKTFARGQWGIGTDDFGRLYTNHNSSIMSAEYMLPDAFNRNASTIKSDASGKTKFPKSAKLIANYKIYPIRMNPGINRGYRKGVLNDEGKLEKVTAACAPIIYRGDNFPQEYYGIGIVAEPAGNLITAFKINEKDAKFTTFSLFNKQEILASTDERFRPVNLYTAPDGSLYVVDMYRGILQHKQFLTEYLKRQIRARDLDKFINLGRIYRLYWDKKSLRKNPTMLDKKPIELVEYLAHPNGWWRDKARQLIIQSQDTTTVAKIKSYLTHKDWKAQVAALWTLEGLNKIDKDALITVFKSKNEKAICHALVLTDKVLQADHQHLGREIAKLDLNSYPIALYIASYVTILKSKDAAEMVVKALNKWIDKENFYLAEGFLAGAQKNKAYFKPYVNKVNNKKLQQRFEKGPEVIATLKVPKKLKPKFEKGKKLYHSTAVCSGCHGQNGEGIATFPPLAESEWVNGSEERLAAILLHGLSGPIKVNGIAYNGDMPEFTASADDIAAVATYIRYSWGNKGGEVKSSTVEKVQKETTERTTPFTEKELNKQFKLKK